ncbi:hypothetical protein QYF36_018698 [Acer negundo]|nr:hypothetical protein QYF36_018698 [Acer negundo]
MEGKKGSLLIPSSSMAYSSFDKGKSTYIKLSKLKKPAQRPKESRQGSLVIGGFWSNTLGSNLAGEGPSLLKTQAGCSLNAQVLASGVAYEGRLCIFGNISKLVGMVDPLAESLSGKDLPGQPNPRLDVMSTEAGLGPSLPLLLEDVVHPCKGDGNEDRHESEVGLGDIMRS